MHKHLIRKITPLSVLSLLFYSFAAKAQLPVPTAPYANGNPIVIGTGAGEYNWTNSKIYGGTGSPNNIDLVDTDITISATAFSGGARTVFAGSGLKNISGTAKVTFNGSNNLFNIPTTNSTDGNYQIQSLFGGNDVSGRVENAHIIMNSGRVRFYIMGGSSSTTGSETGNTLIEINGGVLGFSPDESEAAGQGELYGGSLQEINPVTGNTHIKIAGNKYDKSAYSQGDDVTLIRQHVCGGGGGAKSIVKGNTLIDISGGSIYGMICGGNGGDGGRVEGNTVVNMSGGEVRTDGNGGNGGNIYGGSYRGSFFGNGNTVKGSTFVNISNDAYVQGHIVGGGRYSGRYGTSVVENDATVTIEGGRVDGNVYAGGEGGSSYVQGTATVILKNMDNSNSFASVFSNNIERGAIGASGKANMVFDNYTANNSAKIGSSSASFDTLTFRNNSQLTIDPSTNYYANNWTIEYGSVVNVTGNTSTATTTGLFHNGSQLILDSLAYLALDLRGDYEAGIGSALVMEAASPTNKDSLCIAGTAKKNSNGDATHLTLTLDPAWDGSRINLIQATDAGSDADAFYMDNSTTVLPGRYVILDDEVSGANRIWFITAICAPFNAVITGPSNGTENTTYTFTSNGTPTDHSFQWAVTNGTIISGQGTSEITAQFTANGTVSLIYKNQGGCESTQASHPITITSAPTPCPSFPAVISGPESGCANTEYVFTVNSDAGDHGFEWTVTNGSIIKGQGTAKITAIFEGDGTVALKYKNQAGCESEQGLLTIAIDEIVSTPIIEGTVSVSIGDVSIYKVEENPGVGYLWEVENGTIVSGQGTNEITVEWDIEGEGGVRLVYTQGACSITEALKVTALDPQEQNTPGFTQNEPEQCLDNNLFVFTNTSKLTPPNELVGYLWDFGDGTTSEEENPTHRYEKAGTYRVTLTVFGTLVDNTITKTVTLLDKPVIRTQPSGEIVLCSGDRLQLDVEVDGAISGYQWYKNDKEIPGANDLSYVVENPGESDNGFYKLLVFGPCDSVFTTPVNVRIGSSDLLVQKWENVLAVKSVPEENGGHEFTSYQWYKNGVLMNGETKSYLYVSGEIDYSALYSVRLKTSAGLEFQTCGQPFEPKNNILVRAYPNPVEKGQPLKLEISGVDMNTNVEWLLVDFKGVILQKQRMNEMQTDIRMPEVAGIYILRVNIYSDVPESKYFKIIVK